MSVTDANCTRNAGFTGGSATITINPLPAAIAGANRSICVGGSTILGAAAVGGNTYSWTSLPIGFASTVSNPTVSPVVTTAYTLIETVTATGCTSSNSVVVTVGILPTKATLVPVATPICSGINAQLQLTITDGVPPFTVTIDNGIGTSVINAYTFTYDLGTGLSAGSHNYNITSIVDNCSKPFADRGVTATVIVRPTPTASLSGTITVCQNDVQPNITFTNPQTLPVTITYKINGGADNLLAIGASASATAAVPTATAGSFVYNLVSVAYQAAPACTNAIGVSATVTVRPTPTASISGTITVCQLAVSPNITFTNAMALPVTITYNINAGANTTINVGASTTATVAAPTAAAGTFAYNLVNVYYQAAPTCSNVIAGAATITVTPSVGTPTVPAPATTTICQGSVPTAYTTSATDATSYNWSVTGAGNSIAGAGTTGTVIWGAGFSGIATVSVTANGCNGPSVSSSTTVTVSPTPTATIVGTITVCQSGAAPVITFTNPMVLPVTVTYNINGGANTTINVAASSTNTVAAPTGTAGTFNYNLVDVFYQAAPTCSNVIAGIATVTVRATPVATISGTITVCQSGAAPNITITNPQALPITVTYNINAGGNTTINVGAGTTATLAAATGAAGTFAYNLVSVDYQTAPTCTNVVAGVATVTVRPTPTATISGTTTVCQLAASPNVTFTNPMILPVTITYNINAGASTTINVAGSSTATVAAPTGTSGIYNYNLVNVFYQAAPTCSNVIAGAATITVTQSVGTPVFTLGALSNRCQAAGIVTYTATATNTTGITYTLDAPSLAGGNTIDGTTGAVTYAGTWSGTTTITASAAGCSGPKTSVHTVTVNPLPSTSIITGESPICEGVTNKVYQVDDHSGTTTYWWTLPANLSLVWDGKLNFILVNAAIAGTGNIQVYEKITATGCIGATVSKSVTVSPVIGSDPVLPSVNLCKDQSATFSVTDTPGSTYSWSLLAGAFITGDATKHSVLVTFPLAPITAGIVSVYETNGACSSFHPGAVVNVYTLPVPTITGNSITCVTSTGNIYSTESGMSGYTWAISAGGTITAGVGTNSITVDWPTAGAQTITVNYTNGNGCTASTPTTKSVSVYPLPVPTISGNSTACLNSAGNVYTTETGMTNYLWSVTGGTITSGGGTGNNGATVTWTSTGAQSISVNYTNTNGCTAAVPTSKSVTVNPLPTPTISGSNSVCVGSTGNNYATETGKTNYIWTVSPGGVITAGGTGNDNVTVTWSTTGSKTVTVNYMDANGCTAASATSYAVTVNPLPVITIAGPTPVCATSIGNVYTTQPGMTNYAWTVSAGGTITSGGTPADNTVTVTWNTVGAQTVSVNYTNANGCMATTAKVYNVTVNALPVPTITGNTSACLNSMGNLYTTEAGMTGYTWSITGGTITAGGTPADRTATVTLTVV